MAGPAETESVHPFKIAKQQFMGMFCDLERFDMGLFFCEKIGMYGYDFHIF